MICVYHFCTIYQLVSGYRLFIDNFSMQTQSRCCSKSGSFACKKCMAYSRIISICSIENSENDWTPTRSCLAVWKVLVVKNTVKTPLGISKETTTNARVLCRNKLIVLSSVIEPCWRIYLRYVFCLLDKNISHIQRWPELLSHSLCIRNFDKFDEK